MMLDQKPDVLLLGGSGTLTLATPALVRKYALPTIKTITRMCKEAGIPSMLHSCGRSMAFLEMLYNETDLDCINPLEEPPMGDVDLAEVKRLYGNKVALCGNVHCAAMQTGTPEQVVASAEYCLTHAKPGGGYIFATSNIPFKGLPLNRYLLVLDVWKRMRDY